MRRSNRDWVRPAVDAGLDCTTGPSWQWSPTSTRRRQPSTVGMMASGSVACVASSSSSAQKRIDLSRGSPAPTHVTQTASASSSTARSPARSSLPNVRSSASLRLPGSAARRLASEASLSMLVPTRGQSIVSASLCSASSSTVVPTCSRERASTRTTRTPAAAMREARLSAATLDGAATSTRRRGARSCACMRRLLALPPLALLLRRRASMAACSASWSSRPCRTRCHTIMADVTVLPVPGGPWISVRGCASAVRTAATCGPFSIGMPSTRYTGGNAPGAGGGGGAMPRRALRSSADTACSTSANWRRAACIRAKVVSRHTNRTSKPLRTSVGAGLLLPSSSRSTEPSEAVRTAPLSSQARKPQRSDRPAGRLATSSSPSRRCPASSPARKRKRRTSLPLWGALSQVTSRSSRRRPSLRRRSSEASSSTSGASTFW
mmetsp:Transcript_4711/g.20125  ORF Transcript_4711/g.20125 Transcript_4711/m.20125 type:complete len:436 (+) Transcript_4711:1022-2329(+)